jgi:hypothetical protein
VSTRINRREVQPVCRPRYGLSVIRYGSTVLTATQSRTSSHSCLQYYCYSVPNILRYVSTVLLLLSPEHPPIRVYSIIATQSRTTSDTCLQCYCYSVPFGTNETVVVTFVSGNKATFLNVTDDSCGPSC